jgi:hypothetical protein
LANIKTTNNGRGKIEKVFIDDMIKIYHIQNLGRYDEDERKDINIESCSMKIVLDMIIFIEQEMVIYSIHQKKGMEMKIKEEIDMSELYNMK